MPDVASGRTHATVAAMRPAFVAILILPALAACVDLDGAPTACSQFGQCGDASTGDSSDAFDSGDTADSLGDGDADSGDSPADSPEVAPDVCVECTPGSVEDVSGGSCAEDEKYQRTCSALCAWSGPTCIRVKGWFSLPAAPTGTVGRVDGTVVWTGDEMILFGGQTSTGAVTDQGIAYNPKTNKWRTLSKPPTGGRASHVAVWNGSVMLVWGGVNSAGTDEWNDGLTYDPKADTWATIAAAPISKRQRAGAAWSVETNELIVWGGGSAIAPLTGLGAAYRVDTKTWRKLADPPGTIVTRSNPYMAYDGISMVMFGGSTERTGARYSPISDNWPGTLLGAPTDVVTGTTAVGAFASRVIVWGGNDGTPSDSGAAYIYAGSSWTALPKPSGTVLPSAARGSPNHWDGDGKFWVWGGIDASGKYPTSGAYFDPVTSSWTAMRGTGAPAGRRRAYTVWTGTQALVWGGVDDPTNALSDGARYVP